MSGWCDLGSWKMYYDPVTYEAAVGIRYIKGIRYEFDENGVLIEGKDYIGGGGVRYRIMPKATYGLIV